MASDECCADERAKALSPFIWGDGPADVVGFLVNFPGAATADRAAFEFCNVNMIVSSSYSRGEPTDRVLLGSFRLNRPAITNYHEMLIGDPDSRINRLYFPARFRDSSEPLMQIEYAFPKHQDRLFDPEYWRDTWLGDTRRLGVLDEGHAVELFDFKSFCMHFNGFGMEGESLRDADPSQLRDDSNIRPVVPSMANLNLKMATCRGLSTLSQQRSLGSGNRAGARCSMLPSCTFESTPRKSWGWGISCVASPWRSTGAPRAGGPRSSVAPESLRHRLEARGIRSIALDTAHPDPTDLERSSAAIPAAVPVVIDGYGFDAEYQKALGSAGRRVMVIDDTAHLPAYEGDVLLNPNIGAETVAYDRAPAKRLLGPRFVLLRAEFRKDERSRSRANRRARRRACSSCASAVPVRRLRRGGL